MLAICIQSSRHASVLDNFLLFALNMYPGFDFIMGILISLIGFSTSQGEV